MTVRDLRLDANDDLDLSGGGALVADEEAISQEIKVRLHTDQGEYFLDTTRGLPFQRWAAGKWSTAVQSEARVLLRTELLEVPGVASVDPPGVALTFDSATKRVTCAADLRNDLGELVAVQETV